MYKDLSRTKFVFGTVLSLLLILLAFGGWFLNSSANIKMPFRQSSVMTIRSLVRPELGMYFDYLKYKFEFSRNAEARQVAAAYANLGGSAANAGAVPVLLYHGLLDNPDGANVLLDTFADQMFALKNAGYQTIGMEDLYAFLRGEKTLPPKSFVLTFDDGRKDSFYTADPVLRVVGFKAIMFVITGSSFGPESDYYLDRDELAEMAATGRWELEAHTRDGHGWNPIAEDGSVGHFFSNRLWLASQNRFENDDEFTQRVESDMQAAKHDLMEQLNITPPSFAFPFGDFGIDSVNFPGSQNILLSSVRKFYSMAFYQHAPGVRFTQNYPQPEGDNDFFMVKRIDVNAGWGGLELLKSLADGSVKSLPYSDSFASQNGWIDAWSGYELKPGEGLIMRTGGTTGNTGGAAILDGSYTWQDYEVKTIVQKSETNGVYIWARYKNDKNFAACNFGAKFAHVEETINGVFHVAKGVNKIFQYPAGDFEVGVRVQGRTITCSINGEELVSTEFLDPSLIRGGVGVKTWDQDPEPGELIVRRFVVTGLHGEKENKQSALR